VSVSINVGLGLGLGLVELRDQERGGRSGGAGKREAGERGIGEVNQVRGRERGRRRKRRAGVRERGSEREGWRSSSQVRLGRRLVSQENARGA
jgi:hypothetical protein